MFNLHATLNYELFVARMSDYFFMYMINLYESLRFLLALFSFNVAVPVCNIMLLLRSTYICHCVSFLVLLHYILQFAYCYGYE